jgi:LmbE family N-acetylglucosaminyl deacetylase
VINHAGTNYELRQFLENIDPDVIYLPSFIEAHRDHYAANVLLKNNLIKGTHIAAYEIWTPQVPNRLVNISHVMDQKRRAMMEHASQMKILDYLEAIVGLNRYRAGMYNAGMQYAEAFLECSSEQYFAMMMEVER